MITEVTGVWSSKSSSEARFYGLPLPALRTIANTIVDTFTISLASLLWDTWFTFPWLASHIRSSSRWLWYSASTLIYSIDNMYEIIFFSKIGRIMWISHIIILLVTIHVTIIRLLKSISRSWLLIVVHNRSIFEFWRTVHILGI